MPDPKVGLKVAGKEYLGWKTISITQGIRAVAGAFELSINEKWATQAKPWPILEEDECQVSIDGVTVITGFVDRRTVSYDADSHTLTVAGRDKAAAMVDCSAMLTKNGKAEWEFAGVPLLTLAKRLAEPYGILVALQANLELPTPPPKFSVEPGDSSFDVLERACRHAGVLAISDGDGGVELMRPGIDRCQTALVEGVNIKSASGTFDGSARFRRYVVLATRPGTDQFFGEALVSKGEATDENVRRAERVLLIRGENALTKAQAAQRAGWEAKVRASRADAVTITVQGWTQGDRSLWPVNALVPLRSPFLGINGSMLVSEVTRTISAESGTLTALSLERPDAYLPEPVITKASTGLYKELAKGA
jgi:prophage tail gpP-like protein